MANTELTEGEGDFLEKSCARLIGLCSVIDYKSLAFSRIVDVIAALSCEALKANVKSFSSLDSGDKFAIEVASDLKVLLNGSKLVFGDNNEEAEAVSKIPGIHWRFRDVVKDLHADVRAELNSSVKGGKFGSGNVEALGTRLLALSDAFRNIGECSSIRAKRSFESIENESLKKGLSSFVEKLCLHYENMKNGLKVAYTALFVDRDCCKFAHFVNETL